ncbi:uncharacterized protein LOC121733343 [Aricia agestis]|uniref:uncharacterized protein LOC121733343 n=1 Tax=Aricia agestis TaxID=91739 RepID=UPI001C20A703|nr:uncharacterized protein LOC121733343 [Aricia agestis]
MSVEQLTALSTDSADWKCKTCTDSIKPKRLSFIVPEEDDIEDQIESPSTFDPNKIGTQQHLVQQVLKEIKQEVRKIITEELQRTLKYYSDKIDDFNAEMKNHQHNLKIIENQCIDVKNNLKNISLKYEKLEIKLQQMEQEKLANQLEICGVPEMENENPQEIASKLATVLEQNPQNIIKAYRKRPKAKNQKNTKPVIPAIVVCLREGARNQWLKTAKSIPLSTTHIGREDSDKMYLREVLSPNTAYLLWKSKEELKQLYSYIWCKNGAVLIRQHEKSKILMVRSEADIATLKGAQKVFDKPV